MTSHIARVGVAFAASALLVAGCGAGAHRPDRASADTRLARAGLLRIGDLGASVWETIHLARGGKVCPNLAGLHTTAEATAAFGQTSYEGVQSTVRVFATTRDARLAVARIASRATARCLAVGAIAQLNGETGDPVRSPRFRTLTATPIGDQTSAVSILEPTGSDDQVGLVNAQFVVIRVKRAVLDLYRQSFSRLGDPTATFRPLRLAVSRLTAA